MIGENRKPNIIGMKPEYSLQMKKKQVPTPMIKFRENHENSYYQMLVSWISKKIYT